MREAGAILAGGHTIRDKEPKYGLAVVGTVHPDGVWPKSGARPGDALFLTKPLGTGLVLHGAQRGLAGDQDVEAAVGWMTTLNRDWADVLRAFRPNAVTDVTGFGLLGHAYEMADRSGVRLVLESESWPALDGALEVAQRRGEDRRRPAEPRVRGGARRRRRRRRGAAACSAGTRRRPAACSSRCPRRKGRRSSAELDARGLFVRRIGRVEDGAGVHVD